MAPRLNVGTTTGFYIYSLTPFTLLLHRQFNRGIGVVEQFRSTNIIALCGGGTDPWHPLNLINLWDDAQAVTIGKIETSSPVKKLQFTNSYLLVVLEYETHIYQISDLSLLRSVKTDDNLYSLGILTIQEELIALGTPAGNILHLRTPTGSGRQIAVSRHPLKFITVNETGTLLATASIEGTNIKIVRISTGEILRTLRRGWETVDIASIRFGSNSTVESGNVVVTSNKKTVHLYRYLYVEVIHQVFTLPAGNSLLFPLETKDLYRCIWVDNSSKWRPGYTIELLFNGTVTTEINRIAFPTN